MSTKIYSGFEVRGHTLETLLPELQSLRADLESSAQELAAEWLAQRAATLRDRVSFGLRGDYLDPVPSLYQGMSWVGAAWAEMEQRQNDVVRTQRRNPAVDFSAELVLIPLDGRLLGISFIEHPRLRERWERTPWVTEYGYWNNTDAPDGVTEQAWERRAHDWEQALGAHGVPAHSGYTVQLLSVRGCWRPADKALLARNMPTATKRAAALSLDVYLKEHPLPQTPSDEEGRGSLSAVMRALRMVEESDDYRAWKQDFERRLQPLEVEHLYESADAGLIAQGLGQA